MLPGNIASVGGLIGGGGGTPIPPDPDFADVVLLMGFEGPNNSTTTGMSDESSKAHGSITLSNPLFVKISTTQKKIGSSSLFFNGDYAYYPDSTDWHLGSDTFTIELWVYLSSVTGQQFLVGTWNNTGSFGWVLVLNDDKLDWVVSTDGTNVFADISGSASLTTGVWINVAIDYDGSKYRTYVNGVMDGSSTTARTINSPSNHLTLGANQTSTSLIQPPAYFDELRITKGVARYASDSGFTPQTIPFPRS